MITFSVPGTPVPQPRQRIARHGGSYVTGAVIGYKQSVALIARQYCPRPIPICLPVTLSITFEFVKAKRAARSYPSTCDLDNLVKAVKDALNGIAYDDDRQVTDLILKKRYGLEAQTIIEVF